MNKLHTSFSAGYACLSAWADLLDQINVFPVVDGDTGTNLRISLAPFRAAEQDRTAIPGLLTRCAIGNSGNIAAAFFREFAQAACFADLAERAAVGREKAWQAVAEPCKGTMLSVFDSLAAILAKHTELSSLYPVLQTELRNAVISTPEHLPELKKAGVVDSGALGMYIYFDGFFRQLTGQKGRPDSLLDLFTGWLAIRSSFQRAGSASTNSCCVDAVLQKDGERAGSGNPSDKMTATADAINALGESVVVLEDDSLLKVHIHTDEPEHVQQQLAALGTLVHWDAEKIVQSHGAPTGEANPEPDADALHILTDAAGSISRETADQHGISLLDSYIVTGDAARPESLCDPAAIYSRQRKGGKVGTAQASNFERYQYYESIVQRLGPSLYLCVGSAFTGNYAAATAWKKEHDPDDLLTVLDTGTASGRLALIALLTARYAKNAENTEEVIAYARAIIEDCKEYVFIDELKYLVAGGRVSKAGGFFGDLLGVKPVVSPINNMVRKMGVTRSRKGQMAFALKKLREQAVGSAAPLILLQYSDNEEWLTKTVRPQVRELLPEAEILLTPLSLTSGVHMGPGTWALALTG